MPDPGKGRKKATGDRKKANRREREAKVPRRSKGSGGESRAKLISAVAHPLRRRILRLLHDCREPRSATQIARELGQTLGTVAYHARVLLCFGALEPAGERQVRGAIERFYTSTIEDDPPIETLLEETREVDEEAG